MNKKEIKEFIDSARKIAEVEEPRVIQRLILKALLILLENKLK